MLQPVTVVYWVVQVQTVSLTGLGAYVDAKGGGFWLATLNLSARAALSFPGTRNRRIAA